MEVEGVMNQLFLNQWTLLWLFTSFDDLIIIYSNNSLVIYTYAAGYKNIMSVTIWEMYAAFLFRDMMQA